jgi:hypothetical protein
MGEYNEFVKMAAAMLTLGFLSLIAVVLLNLAIELGRALYRWVLDLPKPQEDCGWLFGKLTNLQGYKRIVRNTWKNSKGKERDLFDANAISCLVIFFAPLAGFLAIKVYPITLAVLLAFGLAHLARFSIRLSRVLKKHVDDPDAHKGGRDE